MRILLTNDDGIRAPGILAMYRELAKWADTHVVAPEAHESATGHGITLSKPLLTQRVTVENGFTGVAVEGRPADCVKVALSQIVTPAPDLVVSGMNAGANVGINVLYSGTIAAAIEAAFLGRPAIAVSLLLKRDIPTQYSWGAEVAMRSVRAVWQACIRPGEVVSINIPALNNGQEPAGVRIVRQCTRPWADTYEKRTSPKDGTVYYWNNSVFSLGESDSDTDVAALREGFVTITPLGFDLTRHDHLSRLAKLNS